MSQSASSKVEKIAIDASQFDSIYQPDEKLNTIVVPNFPALGKLTAMRFLEWVQENSDGVVSLPTGKTPEHFIKWVTHLLATWKEKDTQKILEENGVDPARKPNMRGLHFVQIDEFYPINPQQHNSFHYYVSEYYLEGMGFDPKKAMLINCAEIGLPKGETLDSVWPDKEVDLNLRLRSPRTSLERKQKRVLHEVDEWCQKYERKIRSLGGIGFFLGGIGPDGHIGFNVSGSDHFSTTRLTATNYETQAAAATDLGGIEISRKRLVITTGLGTITFNRNCVAIIIAAGEAKAEIVAKSIQSEEDIHYPATVLQRLPNARFYLTMGAAKHLTRRQYEIIVNAEEITEKEAEHVVIDLAFSKRKSIDELTESDFLQDDFARAVLEKRGEEWHELANRVKWSLVSKIERGAAVLDSKCFLHTEPHHDDLMLGYLPYIVRHVREASNTHYFACLTSGFTAVSNHFMIRQLKKLQQNIQTRDFALLLEQNYFDPENTTGRNRDVWQYLDGVAANRPSHMDEGVARRLLRNLMTIYDEYDINNIKDRVSELMHYFKTQYPGKKDPEYIQRLKGMCREWEAECLWGYFGWNCSNVFHLRLGFYTGAIFTEEPTMERDVKPVLKLLEKVNPDVVSVALDPEASGPDTHYKVLQAITGALKRYEKDTSKSDIRVWGYRNVWYRFHPSEADIFVPVSLNMFSVMQSAFMNTFISQKDASFPSYEHDGPFSELAQKIQVEQYIKIKTCLGREWFYEHDSPMIRATRGLVFLQDLSLPEFYQRSRELKQMAEDR